MSDTGEAGLLPLSALLSQALVAFIIECDNEFERRMPHRTSDHGTTAGQRSGPWLVSMEMWSTCLRFVGDDGITAGELAERARTGTNLAGMRRWGYITVAPDPADPRPKPPQSALVIRLTANGRRARETWEPLPGVMGERWAARFGADDVAALRDALRAVAAQLDPALPDCLPILGFGLWSKPDRKRPAPDRKPPAPGDGARPATDSGPRRGRGPATEDARQTADLAALLSRVLLAFAIEFEGESPVSLAIGANVLRVLDEHGVRLRDLPGLSGVSKEAVSMAMGVLTKQGLAVSGPAPDGGRWQVARLTPRGRSAQENCHDRIGTVERHWQARFGGETVAALREALERLGPARLSEGLQPPPGGWRSLVRAPGVLPQYPMVLHRGGFPDGS